MDTIEAARSPPRGGQRSSAAPMSDAMASELDSVKRSVNEELVGHHVAALPCVHINSAFCWYTDSS